MLEGQRTLTAALTGLRNHVREAMGGVLPQEQGVSCREALAAAVAYVELYTGNGVREQPHSRYQMPSGDFDAEAIARDARIAIERGLDPLVEALVRVTEELEACQDAFPEDEGEGGGNEMRDLAIGAANDALRVVACLPPILQAEPRKQGLFFQTLTSIERARREKHAAVIAEMGEDGWILCWQASQPLDDYLAAYRDGVIGFNARTDCWVVTPQFGIEQTEG